jgi:hypothetical protein
MSMDQLPAIFSSSPPRDIPHHLQQQLQQAPEEQQQQQQASVATTGPPQQPPKKKKRAPASVQVRRLMDSNTALPLRNQSHEKWRRDDRLRPPEPAEAPSRSSSHPRSNMSVASPTTSGSGSPSSPASLASSGTSTTAGSPTQNTRKEELVYEQISQKCQ